MSLYRKFYRSGKFTLDGNIINYTCFIGNNNNIQVVTQWQSSKTTKYNQLMQVLYVSNSINTQ